LKQAGITQGDRVYFPDEMRLGLRGTLRRVLAPRGVKVVQKVQLVYEWTYLLLAVDPLRGQIRWSWIERMNTEHLLPVLRQWKLPCVVWDGAPAHQAQALSELEMVRIRQPAYSPELNPAERVFEEVRRAVEGEVYPSLEAKQQAAEVYLRALEADPERVRQLCGWEWLCTALDALPPAPDPSS